MTGYRSVSSVRGRWDAFEQGVDILVRASSSIWVSTSRKEWSQTGPISASSSLACPQLDIKSKSVALHAGKGDTKLKS
jgi:hypothetical protein